MNNGPFHENMDNEEEAFSDNFVYEQLSFLTAFNAIFNDIQLSSQPINLEQTIFNNVIRESMENSNTISRKTDITLKLPIKKATIIHTTETCAICIASFEKDEDIIITDCNHIFHHGCAEEMIKYKSECPVCRSSIDTKKIDANDPDYQNFSTVS